MIGAQTLGEVLRYNTCITHLLLAANGFKDCDAVFLADGLEVHFHTHSFILISNAFQIFVKNSHETNFYLTDFKIKCYF